MRIIAVTAFTFILAISGIKAQTADSTDLHIRVKFPIGQSSFDYIEIDYRINNSLTLIRKSTEYVFRSEGATRTDSIPISETELSLLKNFLLETFADDTSFPLCRAMSIVYTSIDGYANGRHYHITYAPCRETRLAPPFDKFYKLLDDFGKE